MNFSHCVFTDTTVERLETRDGYSGFNDLNRVSLNGNEFQADYGMTCQHCASQPAENVKFTVTTAWKTPRYPEPWSAGSRRNALALMC
jgi:hypothetical protein